MKEFCSNDAKSQRTVNYICCKPAKFPEKHKCGLEK
jgi:hypothetical protein